VTHQEIQKAKKKIRKQWNTQDGIGPATRRTNKTGKDIEKERISAIGKKVS
jgi:hypothetical protein